MRSATVVSKAARYPRPDLDDYANELARHRLVLPVLAVDVRKKSDVSLLIDILLSQLEADLMEDSPHERSYHA